MTTYRLDPAAFREHVLNAPWMVEAMRSHAEAGKEFAESVAPVDEDGPHPGRYRDAFEVESGTHGGIHGDRAYATLRNTAPEAVYVEFGTERQDAEHVLTRALDVMGGAG